jgi:hypothetical protein
MGSDANSFIPRSLRFALNVPVVLYLRDHMASGRSINVSDSGMLVRFDQTLEIWLKGHLCVVAGEWHLSIDVHIIRVEGQLTALAYEIGSEGDRATIRKLIELADHNLAAPAA